MAYGMNDDEEVTTGDTLLKTMRERLAYLDDRIKSLKPMADEAAKLRAAIIAYENYGKVNYRGGPDDR